MACGLAFSAPTLPAAEPVKLFNGTNLDGFTTWLRDTRSDDPRGVFSVADGAIRISGDGYGYLATKRLFRNYHLKLEFRWGSQAGLDRKERKGKALDSGVFLHATGPHGNSHDGEGAYMAAIECNVFEGATGDVLLIRGNDAEGKLIAPRVQVTAGPRRDADGFPYWQPGGRPLTLRRWGRVNWRGKARDWADVRGFRGPGDLEKPAGEWNRLECVCRNGAITLVLNGTTVNQVTDVSPREGRILLQCEGAEIFFRSLSLIQFEEPRQSFSR
ncbi:MAG: DUF1080 domain-containing protein [Akkermansiaceae bacterium]|nr:DUF1080 domain-containing protein [Akkermansiaceae bacterium]